MEYLVAEAGIGERAQGKRVVSANSPQEAANASGLARKGEVVAVYGPEMKEWRGPWVAVTV